MTLLPASQTRYLKKMLQESVVEFGDAELKWNQVGKIEIEEQAINEKWRQVLSDSLQQQDNKRSSV